MTEKDLQIQELKKEIQKLKEQVPQWIPIKERLPERSGWYLVWTGIIGIPWVRCFSASKQKFFDTEREVLTWMRCRKCTSQRRRRMNHEGYKDPTAEQAVHNTSKK